MKKTLLIAVLSVFSLHLYAQDSTALTFSKKIKAQNLSLYLHKLASDEFEGRETGQKGQKLAAEYIAAHFKRLGIPELKTGGYYQQYSVKKESWDKYSVALKDEKGKPVFSFEGVKPEKGIVSFNTTSSISQGDYKELIFLGYGIDAPNYNDYEGIDVKGKVIVVLDKEPIGKDSNYLVSKSKELSEWTLNWRKKLTTAAEKGAAGIIFVEDNMEAFMKQMTRSISYAPLKLVSGKPAKTYVPSFYMGADFLDKLLIGQTTAEIKETIKETEAPVNFSIAANFKFNINKASEIITAENVLGYVEGSDLKDELIVVTGHYDHLGIEDGKIYYGADDDGSGTSAVMELAQVFALAKKQGHGPRRSMLFMAVSGEEKGLLGSEHYSENPVFPLENTVADLNIDMIGRIDEKHKGNPNYVYVIGSDKLSSELHKINENANSTYSKLELDYTYNDPKDPNRFYYRSDHYNFAKHNVPIIFYFNGVHEDYHKATDTVDKINFEKMEKITRLVFFTAWDLANRTERIKVDVKSDFENTK